MSHTTINIDEVLRQCPLHITEDRVRAICAELGESATVANVLAVVYNIPKPPPGPADEWRQRNEFMDDLYSDVITAMQKKDLKEQ